MSETTLPHDVATPLARSPITPALPVTEVGGWEASGRASTASLTLTDQTPLAKIQVKAPYNGATAAALDVSYGRAARDQHGALIVGSAPGEWLILTEPGTAKNITHRMRQQTAEADELVTVIDLTHGRALMRLTGQASPDVLAKVCAVDLAEAVTPSGAAFRSSVARLVTDIIRDDRGDHHQTPSYLLHCERSSGQYLFDALLDAGREFDIDINGFRSDT